MHGIDRPHARLGQSKLGLILLLEVVLLIVNILLLFAIGNKDLLPKVLLELRLDIVLLLSKGLLLQANEVFLEHVWGELRRV